MGQIYDFVTIYKGNNSITYLADEFEKLGESATPYAVRQNPSENAPFHKFELKDADVVAFFKKATPQFENNGKWDIKALRKLLTLEQKEED